MILKSLRISAVMWIVSTVLFGAVYPAVVTGISMLVFPDQAKGSIIRDHSGKAIGSSLIGQNFTDPKYFWSRLSATGPVPYNAAASTGSNYGVNNAALLDAVKSRISALREADPQSEGSVPVDLVTASGSGLDPHISLQAAEFQLRRVAEVRHLSQDAVRKLIEANTVSRQLFIFGEPVVNVLTLNIALDELSNHASNGQK